MKRIICIILLNFTTLFSNEYKYNCPIPDIIMQTIKLTENNTSYPYLIRTNDKKNINKFNSIIKKFPHSFPYKNDELVIDCKNNDNCVYIALKLIVNGITNLDLGLFQINYKSFKYNLYSYFDEELGYKNACNVILSKIKITKKWNWETIAAYHSLTPNLNKTYKEKLLENYQRIINNEIDTNIVYSINEYSKKTYKESKKFFKGSLANNEWN